jgi:ribonuclease P/MRP protein subunit RPP40
MERVINQELMEYLLTHNLISKQQHGFLRKHSTCSNLLESVNDWSIALNNRLTTDIIYIDFQKAFDSVSHQKLVKKIECYGVRDDLLAWIKAFLTNRTQAVKVNGCISNNISISSGVPQGSVLGPTLFLLFINDIADIFPCLNIRFKLFADDVKLYSSFN